MNYLQTIFITALFQSALFILTPQDKTIHYTAEQPVLT